MELEIFIAEGKSLKNRATAMAEDIETVEAMIEKWDKQVRLWLESSFNQPRNKF